MDLKVQQVVATEYQAEGVHRDIQSMVGSLFHQHKCVIFRSAVPGPENLNASRREGQHLYPREVMSENCPWREKDDFEVEMDERLSGLKVGPCLQEQPHESQNTVAETTGVVSAGV